MLDRSLSRREMVRWLAATSVAEPVLAACARGLQAASTFAAPRVRPLSPVDVRPERVIREVVGLRPFRQSGFRVEAEPFGEKTLIHNYGHGGGGVSLSWGTAALAADLARETPHREAAVLGCGAVGLATARLLQDRGFTVTIYARDLPPNTTSNIAGAQWLPVTVADANRRTPAFDARFVAASRFAFRYYQTLVGPRYGISWRENYNLSVGPRHSPSWEFSLLSDILHSEPLAPGEHPFGDLVATRFLSMHVEPSTYLAAVLADFRLAGGRVVVRDFADRPAIAALPEPVVVNCTGLAAGRLFDDPEVLPIKGQLLVVAPQPEVDYITIGPGDLYMMPRQDGIILGGTHERGVWTLEPNPQETERILRGQHDLFSRMRT